MAFKYCCFVSYPHGQNNVLVPLIQKIVEGLQREVGAQIRSDIWLDSTSLEGGQIIDKEIGSKICQSACMLLIYTPLYFDSEHLYCAQELKAMLDIEEKRLNLLKNKSNGLIIPIILRGEKRYPLGDRWKYYSFTDIEMNDPIEQIPFKYSKEIRAIAEYIVERCSDHDELDGLEIGECNEHVLPSPQVARSYVEQLLKRKIADVEVSFVGRESQNRLNQ